jgi:hypothetical protein
VATQSTKDTRKLCVDVPACRSYPKAPKYYCISVCGWHVGYPSPRSRLALFPNCSCMVGNPDTTFRCR